MKNKILVVEDDELNQRIYSLLLAKEYSITVCSNDKEFSAAIQKTDYDLFIIDLSLHSEKDGIQIIKELRGMDKYKKIPIMVVTAHAFKKDEDNSLAAGANVCIVKPVDNKLLLKEIKKYLS